VTSVIEVLCFVKRVWNLLISRSLTLRIKFRAERSARPTAMVSYHSEYLERRRFAIIHIVIVISFGVQNLISVL